MCTLLVVVGLLLLLINACIRELTRIPNEIPSLALFWVCSLLSRSTFLIASTKHLERS
jgi:hypothetical protein